MGSVWLAEHTTLGKRAAVKLLHDEYSTRQDIVQRFFNEARAATAIADPGIVQVFDFGQMQNGQAYIVMELLDGEALDRRLHRLGKIAVKDALRVMRQVSSTLGAAHARGIVHRDLKPENIFIVRDPEVASGERAKILDFGIAKLGDRSNMKTQTNALMGTPAYMSPEQCRGSGGVDARSDVYALGCLFFSLVTGAPPFIADGHGELIVAHLTATPPLMSSREPHVPAAVDALVNRCLAKDPAARFATATELAQALTMLITNVTGPGPEMMPVSQQHTVPDGNVPPKVTTLAGAAASGSVAPPAPRSGKGKLFAILGVLVVGGGITAAVLASRRGGEPGGTGDPIAAIGSNDTAGTSGNGSSGATSTTGTNAAGTVGGTGSNGANGSNGSNGSTTDSTGSNGPTATGSNGTTTATGSNGTTTATNGTTGSGAAAKLTVVVESTPPGAQVFVGTEPKPRGTTPYTLELEPGAKPFEVKVSHTGYRSSKATITPGKDTNVAVELKKVVATTTTTTKTTPTTTTTKTNPTTTTPTTTEDDLANPFAKKNKK